MNNQRLYHIIKLLLMVLLVIGIFHMPYWYYQLLRIISMIGFILICYNDYNNKKIITSFVFGIAAILFNPLEKISLGKVTWKYIDILFVLVIGFTLILQKSNKKLLEK